MKKMKMLVLLCILALAFTACSKGNDSTDQTPTDMVKPTEGPSAGPSPSSSENPEPTTEPGMEAGVSEEPASTEAQEVINTILAAVREAYGENYIPSIQYDEVSITEYFGIEPELYDAYAAEGPMMSAHIDTIAAIHATEGNTQAVLDALNAFRDRQINDTFQYPSNLIKIQASKVISVDDYVFFIVLGNIDFTGLEDESQYFDAYEAQNQIAIDVIYSILTK